MAKKQQTVHQIKILGLNDIKSLNVEISKLAGNYDKLGKEGKKASESTKKVGKGAKDASGGISKFAKGATAAAVALVAFSKISKLVTQQIKQGIEVFKGFEFEMAKVKAISGATEDEFDSLNKTAQELGRSTFFTAQQVAALQLNFSKLGFTASEVLQAQEAALFTATATGEDLARTATVIGSTIRGFGLDARDSARVSDVMAASFTSSALTLEKFQTSMTKVSPVAKLLGMDLEETTAVMGVLTDAGIEASIAGTSLRNIFLKLGDPSSDLAKSIGFTVNSGEDMVREFRRMRDEGVNVEKMLEVVDVRQVAAISTMIEHIDKIELQTEAFRNSAGAAEEMANIVGDSLQGATLRFQSALDGLRIVLVDKIAPLLTDTIDFFATMFNSLAKLSEQTDNYTKSLADQYSEITKTDELIKQSVSRYDELSSKQNLSKSEMQEMNTELTKLTELFGVNMTAINKETGALELNRDELIRQLRLRKALQSETAIDLLAQRQDMEALAKEHEEMTISMNTLFGSAMVGMSDYEQQLVGSLRSFIRDGQVNIPMLHEQADELNAMYFKMIMNPHFQEALKIQGELFKGVDDDGNTASQALVILDAKLSDMGINIGELDKMFNKSFLGKEDGFTLGEPTGDFESIEDSSELLLQSAILEAKKEFFASEVETKEEFSLRLLGIEINHLEQTFKLLEDGSDAKFQIEKRLTDAKIKLKEQEANAHIKSEEDKRKATENNIATMKETGKLLMQIGEQQGENSKITAAGIKITQAAAIADGIHGLINAEVGIAEQAKLPFPSNLIAMAATAAQVVSVIANIKSFIGGGGGGGSSDGEATFLQDSQGNQFANGGLTRGGMFQGNSHANGGVKFRVGGRIHEAEGGEAIINKKSTSMFRPMLSAINSYNGNGVKFADGGLLNSGEKFAMGGELRSAQQLVSGGMGSSKVVIVESDMTEVQNRISAIESQATF